MIICLNDRRQRWCDTSKRCLRMLQRQRKACRCWTSIPGKRPRQPPTRYDKSGMCSHPDTRIYVLLLRLQEIFDQGIFEGKPLAPGFAAPEPEGMDHHLYSVHIKNSLPQETPGMFGMPANAETGYLTNAADEIFAAFLRWVGVIVSESCVPSTYYHHPGAPLMLMRVSVHVSPNKVGDCGCR